MNEIKERSKALVSQILSSYLQGDRIEVMREIAESFILEQKAIDDAELARLKKAWEKEAEVNHDAEKAYKQGYHDAIDKACEGYCKMCGYYNKCKEIGNFECGATRYFRKAMEV